MTAVLAPIPRYKFEVAALKISNVIPSPRGFLIGFENQRFVPIEVTKEWHENWFASPGDYLVWNGDQLECWGALWFEKKNNGANFSLIS